MKGHMTSDQEASRGPGESCHLMLAFLLLLPLSSSCSFCPPLSSSCSSLLPPPLPSSSPCPAHHPYQSAAGQMVRPSCTLHHPSLPTPCHPPSPGTPRPAHQPAPLPPWAGHHGQSAQVRGVLTVCTKSAPGIRGK